MAGGVSSSDCQVQLGSVIITEREILEYQDGCVVARVPRDTTVRLAITTGIVAERPVLQVVLGIGLVTAGAYFALVFFTWLVFQSEIRKWSGMLILMAPFGLWLCLDAARRGTTLRVTTKAGTRKMRFGGNRSQSELMGFVVAATKELGCRIDLT